MSISEQIRRIRLRASLTQRQLGRLLGVTRTAVSRLERPDYRGHRVEVLVRIAEALSCELSIELRPTAETPDVQAEVGRPGSRAASVKVTRCGSEYLQRSGERFFAAAGKRIFQRLKDRSHEEKTQGKKALDQMATSVACQVDRRAAAGHAVRRQV